MRDLCTCILKFWQCSQGNLEELGIKVDIYNKKAIEELGMKAFLAVAEGSSKEPRFFVMTYNGILIQRKNCPGG